MTRRRRRPIRVDRGALTFWPMTTLLVACNAITGVRDFSFSESLSEGGSTPGAAGSGGAAAGGGGAIGGEGGTGGARERCEPNLARPCYTGPQGTQNVGLCIAGEETCSPDGSGFGPCVGQVI